MSVVIPQLITGVAPAAAQGRQTGADSTVQGGAPSATTPGQTIAAFSHILATLRGDLVATVNNSLDGSVSTPIAGVTQTDALVDIQLEGVETGEGIPPALLSFIQSLPQDLGITDGSLTISQLHQALTSKLASLSAVSTEQNASLITGLQQSLNVLDKIIQQGGAPVVQLNALLESSALSDGVNKAEIASILGNATSLDGGVFNQQSGFSAQSAAASGNADISVSGTKNSAAQVVNEQSSANNAQNTATKGNNPVATPPTFTQFVEKINSGEATIHTNSANKITHNPELQTQVTIASQVYRTTQQQTNASTANNPTTLFDAPAIPSLSINTHLGGQGNPLFQQHPGNTPQTLLSLQASGAIETAYTMHGDVSLQSAEGINTETSLLPSTTAVDNLGKQLTQKVTSGEYTSPVEQIKVQVTQAVKEGSSTINLHLEPSSLGKVDVKLDFGVDGKTTVLVLAEKAETLDLLQRDARQLEKALNDAGIKTDSGSLSFNLQQGDSQQQGQFAENKFLQHFPTVSQEEDVVGAEQIIQAYANQGNQGGLDIRV